MDDKHSKRQAKKDSAAEVPTSLRFKQVFGVMNQGVAGLDESRPVFAGRKLNNIQDRHP
jgi:hypothetical protein